MAAELEPLVITRVDHDAALLDELDVEVLRLLWCCWRRVKTGVSFELACRSDGSFVLSGVCLVESAILSEPGDKIGQRIAGSVSSKLVVEICGESL